jgi:hypothetical protein
LFDGNVAFGNGGNLASVDNSSIVLKSGIVFRHGHSSKSGGCLFSSGPVVVISKFLPICLDSFKYVRVALLNQPEIFPIFGDSRVNQI